MSVAGERVRSTAPERRQQIIAAAIKRFGAGGLHGTSTEDIAADTGLSQPYLFRLFGTKRELFLACCEFCTGQLRTQFAQACTGDTPEERLHSMGSAYGEMLADEHYLRFQLQMYAASGEADIRERTSVLFRALVDDVRVRSGADTERLHEFLSVGMLLNVATMLRLDEILCEYEK